MTTRRITLLLLALPLLGACEQEEESMAVPVPIRTSDWRPGDAASFASIAGTVAEAPAGCVVVQPAGGAAGIEIVWPADWYAARDGGLLTVYRGDGSVATRAGEEIFGAGSALDEPGCTNEGTFSLSDDLR